MKRLRRRRKRNRRVRNRIEFVSKGIAGSYSLRVFIRATLVAFLFVLPVYLVDQASTQSRNSNVILTEPPRAYDHRIAYGNGPAQFGELRLPKGSSFKKPFPVAVVVHGGCWVSRFNLDYMSHLSADLAAAGVATWSIEYRRVGDDGGAWPGTFIDAGAGLDYVRTLAMAYGLDLRRVVVVGHSAGGHLALWLAARGKLGKESPIFVRDPLPLAGVVALAAITDLRRSGTACDVNVGQLMRGTADKDATNYEQASPISLLPLGVRQIIVQGDSDRFIPTAMATTYVDAAKQKGDSVKLVLIEKAGHFDLVDPQASAWARVKEEILALLSTKSGG